MTIRTDPKWKSALFFALAAAMLPAYAHTPAAAVPAARRPEGRAHAAPAAEGPAIPPLAENPQKVPTGFAAHRIAWEGIEARPFDDTPGVAPLTLWLALPQGWTVAPATAQQADGPEAAAAGGYALTCGLEQPYAVYDADGAWVGAIGFASFADGYDPSAAHGGRADLYYYPVTSGGRGFFLTPETDWAGTVFAEVADGYPGVRAETTEGCYWPGTGGAARRTKALLARNMDRLVMAAAEFDPAALTAAQLTAIAQSAAF